MLPEIDEERVLRAAKTAYEVNRVYCAGLGDDSHPAWEDAPLRQKTSYLNGVHGIIAGNSPEGSHRSWLEEKRVAGWKYGPVKDTEKQEHPCFVPYDQLPKDQRIKDTLFALTVGGVLGLVSF